MTQIEGSISQIVGPVVDVTFQPDTPDFRLPAIHDAMEIHRADGRTLIVEVQQHIGEHTVRTVAMDSTDGLQRHMKATALGHPISVPTGDQIKGRLFNVIGAEIDGMKPQKFMDTGVSAASSRRWPSATSAMLPSGNSWIFRAS